MIPDPFIYGHETPTEPEPLLEKENNVARLVNALAYVKKLWSSFFCRNIQGLLADNYFR